MCLVLLLLLLFFKQKTAYDMRISDWMSDVCSSDLEPFVFILRPAKQGCTSVLRKSRASRKLLRRRDNGERGIGCDANAEIDLHSVGADRHWDGLDARQVQAFSHQDRKGVV